MKDSNMVENQHRLIKGYRDLSPEDIEFMNQVKQFEAEAASLVQRVRAQVAERSRRRMGEIHEHKQLVIGQDGLERAYDRHGAVTEESVRVAENYRQVALARTNFEVAFMHLVRAVAAPDSVWNTPTAVTQAPASSRAG